MSQEALKINIELPADDPAEVNAMRAVQSALNATLPDTPDNAKARKRVASWLLDNAFGAQMQHAATERGEYSTRPMTAGIDAALRKGYGEGGLMDEQA